MSDKIHTGSECSVLSSSSLDYDEVGPFGENVKYECYPSPEPFEFSYDDIRVYREIHHNSKVSVMQLARMLSMSENGVVRPSLYLKSTWGLNGLGLEMFGIGSIQEEFRNETYRLPE